MKTLKVSKKGTIGKITLATNLEIFLCNEDVKEVIVYKTKAKGTKKLRKLTTYAFNYNRYKVKGYEFSLCRDGIKRILKQNPDKPIYYKLVKR